MLNILLASCWARSQNMVLLGQQLCGVMWFD